MKWLCFFFNFLINFNYNDDDDDDDKYDDDVYLLLFRLKWILVLFIIIMSYLPLVYLMSVKAQNNPYYTTRTKYITWGRIIISATSHILREF